MTKIFPDFLAPVQKFHKTGESNMDIGKMDAGDENNEDKSSKTVIELD